MKTDFHAIDMETWPRAKTYNYFTGMITTATYFTRRYYWKNSVIRAGSVVTKDIPSNCVAVGNLCRVIKKIFWRMNK